MNCIGWLVEVDQQDSTKLYSKLYQVAKDQHILMFWKSSATMRTDEAVFVAQVDKVFRIIEEEHCPRQQDREKDYIGDTIALCQKAASCFVCAGHADRRQTRIEQK